MNKGKLRVRDVLRRIKDAVFDLEGIPVVTENVTSMGNVVDVSFSTRGKKEVLMLRFNSLALPEDLASFVDEVAELILYNDSNWFGLEKEEVLFLLDLHINGGEKVFQGVISEMVAELETIGAVSLHLADQADSWKAKISVKGEYALKDLRIPLMKIL